MENKKRLVIIDGNALVHRAFHALPPLASPQGEPVNAVYGFLLVFLKVLKDLQPQYVAASFDLPGPTFRDRIYAGYKAKRPKAPDELYEQIPLIKEILQKLGVPIFEKQGYEADDVIGTIVKIAKRQQIDPEPEIIIVTGDLDALRLIDENTKVYALKRGLKDVVVYNQELVRKKYDGLVPEQLTDFRALRGDPSDNIPGVTGIGEKTAIMLLKNYGTLEKIYLVLEKQEGPKGMQESVQEKLKQYKEQALISKKLAKIDNNVPVDFVLEKCYQQTLDRVEVVEMFQKLGFYSLIKRLPENTQLKLGNF
jgi:DNA polymerase I